MGAATLRGEVQAAFADRGALARADAGYRPRAAQEAMADAVAAAIEDRAVLVAEAGTGVGKTYAYLVPALLAGRRTLVSTATKSLQDQLVLRDIPRLRDALGVAVTVSLLKGRASYLCRHRLPLARRAIGSDAWSLRALARVERWSHATTRGDLAEVDGLGDRSPVIPLVTSTRENCLGAECPEYRRCCVVQARRDALAADLVVVNHHLWFADLSLREGGGELLPNVDVAIFDEAHQLAEAGVQFLGTTLGTAQWTDFARDLVAAGLQFARGLGDWSTLAAACERAARELHLACAGTGEVRAALRVRWESRQSDEAFVSAIAAAATSMREAASALAPVAPTAPDLARLAARAAECAALGDGFAAPTPAARVRWIDVSAHQARLVESPLDIRDALREQIDARPRTWIFTSATLGDDERLSWFTASAGLADARIARLGSPFDYAAQARLFVPRVFPRPSEPGHPLAVARLAAHCTGALGGRTFVLTTTLRAMRQIADALRRHFEDGDAGIAVLAQGEVPKRQLLQRFVERPQSVLVASYGFWEGIDVPGDALQCVVLDKLPFPPPGDPLVEARVQRLRDAGADPFADYFVAEAAVSLKQGAGRLIRSESDRGLLVVCDPRLATMPYGRRLRQALPPMGVVATPEEALDWLESLRVGA